MYPQLCWNEPITQSFQERLTLGSPFCSESSVKHLFFTSGLDSRTISSNRVHPENVLGSIPPALCGRGEGTRTVAGSLGYTPLLGSRTETLRPTYLATVETDDKGGTVCPAKLAAGVTRTVTFLFLEDQGSLWAQHHWLAHPGGCLSGRIPAQVRSHRCSLSQLSAGPFRAPIMVSSAGLPRASTGPGSSDGRDVSSHLSPQQTVSSV